MQGVLDFMGQTPTEDKSTHKEAIIAYQCNENFLRKTRNARK